MFGKASLQMISYCIANFYLEFKNPVFEGKVIFSFFVKICKKFKLSRSWHAALVSFAKTPQKLSLQKISRKNKTQPEETDQTYNSSSYRNRLHSNSKQTDS